MADRSSLIKITVDVEKGILEIGNLKVSLNDSNAAAQGLNNTLNQQTKVVDGSAAAIRRKIAAAKAERDMTASNNAQYVKQTQIVNKLEAELLELTHTQQNVSSVSLKTGKSLATMQKNLGSVNSAAGLAGASVMETGRLISDLPYGIQGAANNLSQLGSMFGMLVAQAGKMNNGLSTSRNVINLLSSQFFGPLGIIVAFQAAVAAIEFFTKKQAEAKREANKLTKEIEDQNKSLKEQQALLTRLGGVVLGDEAAKVLGRQLKEVGQFLEAAATFGEVTEDVVNFAVEEGKKIVQAKQTQNKATAELLKLEQELADHTSKSYKEMEISQNKYAATKEALEQDIASTTTDLINAIKQEEDSLKALNLEKQEALVLDNDKKDSAKKDSVIIKGTIDDYNAQIDKLEELSTSTATTKQEFDDLTYQIQLLKSEMEEKFGLGDEEEKTSFVDDIVAGAYDSGTLYKDQLEEMNLNEENYFKHSQGRARESKRTKIEEAKIAKKVHNEKTKIQDAENRNAVKAFQLLGNISKEGSKLQALALIGESAANVARIVSSTKASNAGIRLKYNTLPDSKIPGAKIRMKKNIALNNASAAINIASTVAATQKALAALKESQSVETPDVGRESGVGSDDQGQAEPDFNVVGASQLNQLASAIAEQEEQPVRAYVVASDVSTAQELDRNILSEASIG